ncbi:MAG: hypothetical protein JWP65_3416 [Ramlibacter sp.]|jgi:hypothetical protein|uniref:hypothetical protein n=1 Tax=Ramlibacter sp. TaxID=1917967 RepID=UPI002638C00A|nr:hypothetical protein [Ramlibacter sp.]MDB5752995.1 hypothetical protein [Ramlibacter sp.]
MPVSNPGPRPGLPSAAAEAARYALLRRLAPSMRHHLVVNLQPIGMIYEVMERRLRSAQPDLAHLHDSAGKINGFARAALASSIEVVGWLAPDETVGTTVEEAVRECASLLATSLSFRGYALRNEATPLPRQVRRSAIRSLLTGALVYTTDHLEPSSALVITAQAAAQGAIVRIAVRPSEGDKGFAAEAAYRKLEWADLDALAAADGVALEREGQGLAMQLPWMPPAQVA